MNDTLDPHNVARADDAAAKHAWLSGGGEMGHRIRSLDWSGTVVGAVETWPQSLRSAVGILLPSRAQIILFWGPERVVIYNDAYRPVLGAKHPTALGHPGREVWREIWDDTLSPLLDGVVETGGAFWAADHPFALERHGYREETYFDVSYDPVRDESGAVGGVFCIVSETTGRVVGERRLRLLRDLGRVASDARTVDGALAEACSILDRHPYDLSFAGLLDGRGRAVASSRLAVLDGWPLTEAARAGSVVLAGDQLARFGKLSGGAWPEPAAAAVVLPIATPGQQPLAFMVAGVSPRRVLDEDYRAFLGLVASSIGGAAAAARRHAEERARAEALAAIDRAKIAFFSNVSHEFRTPLTLILGPLEDLLADQGRARLTAEQRERVDVASRNARRLLRLVNALLDFSRTEAGRANARFEEVDLAAFTSELASNFHSACERAGLSLEISCAPLRGAVWVDPVMWEKIVLNLMSNALKFTFEGGIEVRLEDVEGRPRLTIRDSGVGIPAHEMTHVFERFHRVEGMRSRTHEGSGIGLALVDELARLHGADASARSEPGRGSEFTVTLRYGAAHLPPDRLAERRHEPLAITQSSAFMEEADGWLRDDERPSPSMPTALAPLALTPVPWGERAPQPRPRILVVDDNADMRNYLARLLRERWHVTAVADAESGLERLDREPFDLVISDVMMPRIDGLAFLRAVKSSRAHAELPVMLLSARAGEEARIEGLGAGADDYVVKPFTAAQLVAQVNAQLTVLKTRRDSAREREGLLARELAAKREAELNRAHLVSLFTQAPNPIVILRGPAHVVELANPAVCRVWGRTENELLGRPLFEAIPELRGQVWEALLEDVLRSGEPFEGREVAAHVDRRGDGTLETVYFNFVYTPLRAASGDPEGILVTAFDVTAQVVARTEMSRLRGEAEAASRAKDEFLAMLSHELRNPLAPIVTALTLLKLNGQRGPELEILERQAGHLTRLVDDLLDVSRITRRMIELKKRRMELGEALDKAVELALPLLEERRHTLDRRGVPRAGLEVDADPARLAQILSNLLTNASKYSEPGSRIAVRAGRDGDRIRVVVADEGVGIARDMIDRVFDPFVQQPQTLDRSEGGLGLGLAIVRHLTELHGGRVSARSEGLGRGSEFTVELPAASGEVSDEPATDTIAGRASGREGRRILVVDDNLDAARTLSLLLRRLGHVVETAHDGVTCLEKARAMGAQVAFVDIGLPGLDGYQVARELRRRQAEGGAPMLIVAVTGYGLEADRQRSALAGFDHHLVKPVELSAVEALLVD